MKGILWLHAQFDLALKFGANRSEQKKQRTNKAKEKRYEPWFEGTLSTHATGLKKKR
jgi:hypothetical protein